MDAAINGERFAGCDRKLTVVQSGRVSGPQKRVSMSAPPLRRIVSERRVSVVRDGASVRRVFDDDPVGSCMVAARVADHGLDPNAIGGELWTRRGPERVAVLRRRQPDSAARRAQRSVRVRRRGDDRLAALLVAGRPGRAGDADVAAARAGLGPGARRARPSAVDVADHDADLRDRSRCAPGQARRARHLSGGGRRHVHRRGRRRPAAG